MTRALNGHNPGMTEPGWHPDPDDPSRNRWWDGTQWRSQKPQPKSPASKPLKIVGSLALIAIVVMSLVVIAQKMRSNESPQPAYDPVSPSWETVQSSNPADDLCVDAVVYYEAPTGSSVTVTTDSGTSTYSGTGSVTVGKSCSNLSGASSVTVSLSPAYGSMTGRQSCKVAAGARTFSEQTGTGSGFITCIARF